MIQAKKLLQEANKKKEQEMNEKLEVLKKQQSTKHRIIGSVKSIEKIASVVEPKLDSPGGPQRGEPVRRKARVATSSPADLGLGDNKVRLSTNKQSLKSVENKNLKEEIAYFNSQLKSNNK
jgi:hypothetical protein